MSSGAATAPRPAAAAPDADARAAPHEADPNAAVILSLFAPTCDVQWHARTLLARQVLSEPIFDELRTKQSLGYIVHSSSADMGELSQLLLLVQSNRATSWYLLQQVEVGCAPRGRAFARGAVARGG